MKIEDYEIELKKLDDNLNIKVSPQAPDMAGIYYQTVFITGIPSGEIFEAPNPDYKDAFGTVHKCSEVATAQVKQWLANKDEELAFEEEFQREQKRQYGR